MKKFFSEKNLRKQGLRFRPKKLFKKKISINDVPKRLSGLPKLVYGDVGIMAMESSRFTFRQLDSIRRSLMKIRWKTCVWLKLKATIPLTKKPANSRMGKGKGKFNCIVGNVLKYQIVMEFTTLDFFFYGAPIHSAMTKLPFKSKLVFDKTRKGHLNFDYDLNIDGLGRCNFKYN